MFTFNESNIDLLEAIIHDADFHIRDLPDAGCTGTCVFPIRRPDWAQQERRKWLFWNMIYVKEVSSHLKFENIERIEYEWRDDLYNKPGDHHSIMSVHIDTEQRTVTFDTAYLLASFVFDPSIKISLEDAGQKKPIRNFLSIVGRKGFDYNNWLKEYHQKTKEIANTKDGNSDH